MKIAALESVLLSLESGARPKGGVSSDSGEIPSLGGEHVNSDGGFDFTNIKRIPLSFFEAMRGGRIMQSDILVVKDGATTGKTSFVREDFPFKDAAVNEHVFCVRVDSIKASPAFIYHFLRSERGQKSIRLDFRGATVGGISREFATKTQIPLPPLAEQRRIAEVLDQAEALRAKRRAALAQLDEFTQSLFFDLFGDPRSIPERNKWTKTPLGECTEIISGATPSTSVDAYWNGSICWATPKDLSELEGMFISDTPRKLTRAGMENCAATMLPPSSVLFSSRAPIGHVAINTVPMATNQGFKSFIPNPARINETFLYWWLRINRSYLESLGNGATFKEVSKAIVARIEIPLPPLPLQHEFAQRVAVVEKLKTAHRAALAESDALFASLQHRAFRGEL